VTEFVTMPDGRDLAYEVYGDPEGTPVLSFHGGLSSRLDAAPAHEAARDLGIRLISPDRPGIGLSTYQPDRRLLDWPDDIAALTDALGLDRFAVMGWSCGGPYAAACGARLSDRVTAVALLSSAVALDVFGTTKGLTLDDRLLLLLVRRTPRLASALMRITIAEASEARLQREMLRSFPGVDRAILRDRATAPGIVAFVKESMRQGTEGSLQEYRIFGDPWGFSLEEVRAPVHIWEGADDRTGPPAYRQFLADHLPDARVTVVPNEGHLSLLVHQAPEILASLVGSERR
jgi:pimeloyl-ACP methyl ester carboxylesterase